MVNPTLSKCATCGELYSDTEVYANHSIECPACHAVRLAAEANPRSGVRGLMEKAARACGFSFGV